MPRQILAPAKINLTLKITGRRNDGYHTLLSHVVFADFGDILNIDILPSKDPKFTLQCAGEFAKDVPKVNTLTKAFELFCQTYNVSCETQVKLTKNIPTCAGLGGGSSDAAALLRALFDHFKPAKNDDDLYNIAQKIGADVPVCLRAKPTLMRGAGEILEDFNMDDLNLSPPHHCVLVWANAGASTQELYDAYDAGNYHASELDNDFMAVAPQFCPAINEALAYLKDSKQCYKIGLSGSGSTVFGLCRKPFEIKNHSFPWLKTCMINP